MQLTPRSLRARLTVLLTLGAAAALGVCLTLLFVALDRQLAAALDADLRSRGADLTNAVRAGDVGVVARDPIAQLYSADGVLLTGTPALGDRRLMSVYGSTSPAPPSSCRATPIGSGRCSPTWCTTAPMPGRRPCGLTSLNTVPPPYSRWPTTDPGSPGP